MPSVTLPARGNVDAAEAPNGVVRRRSGCAVAAACAVAMIAAACGADDFANKPRPAKPLQLTGVITDDAVEIQPNEIGAGPVIINISNQTDDSHTITLEGDRVRERVGPVNPLDAAAIQKTLPPGSYRVTAGSSSATAQEIPPGILTVGAPRDTSSDDTLLP